MKRNHLVVAAIVLLAPLAFSLCPVRRASAKNNNHKPALHDADCAHVAMATDVVGFAVLEMDGSGTLQVELSVKHALPKTEYKVVLLADPCTIIFTGDNLTTNKKGKGNEHLMVPAASIPLNAKVAVQLVTPPNPTAANPVTDTITSDFVTPQQGSDAAESGF